jgi:hypothetical protein
MAIELFYNGKKYATVSDDKISFVNKDADLNGYLDSLFIIGQEEDENGNTLFVQQPLSLQAKLLELSRIGFEIRGETS